MPAHVLLRNLANPALLLVLVTACSKPVEPEKKSVADVATTPTTVAVLLPTSTYVHPENHLPLAMLSSSDQSIPGTLLSYGFASGEELGAYDASHLYGVELGTASLTAGDTAAIVVDTTSVIAFQARITQGIEPSAPTVVSFPAVGTTSANNELQFTLQPPGVDLRDYQDHLILRARLDVDHPASGTIEYGWHLEGAVTTEAPGNRSVLDSSTAIECQIPDLPIVPTTTPVADPGWAEVLQQSAPETMTNAADLVLLGAIGEPAVTAYAFMRSSHMALPEIHTYTPFQVECALKGAPAASVLTIRTFGGCIDGRCNADLSEPLVIGQRGILFLRYFGPEYASLRQADGSFATHDRDYVTLVSGEDALYRVKDEWAISTRHRYTVAEIMERIAGANP